MLRSLLAAINLRFFWEFNAGRFGRETWQNRIFPQHRWLLKQIVKFRPGSILEAGCGFGRNLNWLIKQGVKQEILTGVDFSARLLFQAQLPHSVKLIQANVLNLPFSANHFDLVFTHGLLMHLSPRNLTPAFKELFRVTKK